MDTYASPHNCALNHTMMVLHAYLSLALVAATVTGGPVVLGHAWGEWGYPVKQAWVTGPSYAF